MTGSCVQVPVEIPKRARLFLGSARASRADFGASPKVFYCSTKKVVGEAPTTTREGACTPQITRSQSSFNTFAALSLIRGVNELRIKLLRHEERQRQYPTHHGRKSRCDPHTSSRRTS